jgi:broad specificity phosphatase PhoE
VSRILLIRHAQASFGAPDYDRLSSVGETQAHLLGSYWTKRNVTFDRVYAGPRKRQIDTAKIVAARYQAARLPFPEPRVMPEFDEYDGERVLSRAVPQLVNEDDAVRELHQAYVASANGSEQQRRFQRLFELVIGKWVNGEVEVSNVESWAKFCARVNRGISEVLSDAKSNERVAVFSSGGPIAVAMQRALNLSARDALRVSWMSRNCAYSEFVFSVDRFTLSTFNSFPHLDDVELLTYR